VRIKVEGKTLEYKDINAPQFEKLLPLVAQNSMASAFEGFPLLYSLYCNIEHLVRNDISGDVVECGVWRGGMMQLAALTLIGLGDTSRKIYLYDTYDGMPDPGKEDLNWDGISPRDTIQHFRSQGEKWGFGGSIETVRETMLSTGYPEENLVFVKGMVEETIPEQIPEQIALLRLDTDFYESTLHELEHLYPLLVSGGFLIIDDYGYYKGARRATDQYLAAHQPDLWLSRIHDSVRIGVKP
jgi:O-methyltransferase